MEDMARRASTRRSASPTRTSAPTDDGAYATRHNPFVYFHSITDSPDCAKNDVPLTQLETDLASIKTTANYNMITPNVCNDAHDETCPDGEPGGLDGGERVAADLGAEDHVVARVQEGRPAGHHVRRGRDSVTAPTPTSCCNEPQAPNVAQAGLSGPGGGHVGALLLSPYVKAASTNSTPYNHYALLCSIENLFGLQKLGYAGMSGLQCFDSTVYNNPKGTTKVNAAAS